MLRSPILFVVLVSLSVFTSGVGGAVAGPGMHHGASQTAAIENLGGDSVAGDVGVHLQSVPADRDRGDSPGSNEQGAGNDEDGDDRNEGGGQEKNQRDATEDGNDRNKGNGQEKDQNRGGDENREDGEDDEANRESGESRDTDAGTSEGTDGESESSDESGQTNEQNADRGSDADEANEGETHSEPNDTNEKEHGSESDESSDGSESDESSDGSESVETNDDDGEESGDSETEETNDVSETVSTVVGGSDTTEGDEGEHGDDGGEETDTDESGATENEKAEPNRDSEELTEADDEEDGGDGSEELDVGDQTTGDDDDDESDATGEEKPTKSASEIVDELNDSGDDDESASTDDEQASNEDSVADSIQRTTVHSPFDAVQNRDTGDQTVTDVVEDGGDSLSDVTLRRDGVHGQLDGITVGGVDLSAVEPATDTLHSISLTPALGMVERTTSRSGLSLFSLNVQERSGSASPLPERGEPGKSVATGDHAAVAAVADRAVVSHSEQTTTASSTVISANSSPVDGLVVGGTLTIVAFLVSLSGGFGSVLTGGVAGSTALFGGTRSLVSKIGRGRRRLRRLGNRCSTLIHGWSDRFDLPWLPFIPGYSRHDDSDPLENETRRAIYETVEERPGVYHAKVVEETDIPLSTVRYHCQILDSEGLIQSELVRGKRCLFPLGETNPELATALEDETLSDVLDAIGRLEPATVSELSTELDRAPSTVSHHLSRLDDANLVVRTREGRSVTTRLDSTVRAAIVPVDHRAGANSESERASA